MNFGEWMAVEIPPEKQFLIEKQCRDIQRHPDIGPLAAKAPQAVLPPAGDAPGSGQ
jgi:hypothetical protein